MDIVYAMPDQKHRLFINVIHACPNACLFCVDFKGDAVHGFDLKKGKPATVDQIVKAVERYPLVAEISEVYFCGIGEPLLYYDVVVQAATHLRHFLDRRVLLAINTSGTFYRWNPRVEFARCFDLIQVSLNAESEEKYDQICRPKFCGTYRVLMSFLRHLAEFIKASGIQCRVELSIVDTSDTDSLPESERERSDIPRADLEACQKVADAFGWPLRAKRLIKDCEKPEWRIFSEMMKRERVSADKTC